MNLRLSPELRRRSVAPLLAAALAVGYVFVLAPLSRRAESLDGPLQQSWRKLTVTLGQTNATRVDFTAITNQLAETRRAIAALESARQRALARIQPGETLRARLQQPFQLVDYDNEVGERAAALTRLAREHNVALDPAVFAGFPRQTADVREPNLLWAELEFIDQLLRAAIQARLTAIHSVSTLSPLTNAPPTNGLPSLAELPVQLELSGPAPHLARFLQTLPRRGEELIAAGHTNTPPDKPALFIERLLVRKQSPDRRDEVRATLRAVGFVLRQTAP
jgi:hypothetical protein